MTDPAKSCYEIVAILELDLALSIGLITGTYKRQGDWLCVYYIPEAISSKSTKPLPSLVAALAPLLVCGRERELGGGSLPFILPGAVEK